MRKATFRGGVHPLRARHEGKAPTRGLPVREYAARQVTIPMGMHLGAPSIPCVKPGDAVRVGQVIGEACGPRGLPVHASVSGVVTAVDEREQLGGRLQTCVTIQNDFKDEWVALQPLGDVETVDPARIVPAIRAAGISGMGGAAFPTHAKLTLPPGKTVDTILLNGSECETCLTADHRLMVESPERVVKGLRAAMRAMGVARGIIAIEDNKPDAIEVIRRAAQGRQGESVVEMVTKYPEGGEKQMIAAVLGREVPSGGLPADAHVVVLNVGTAAAIADAIEEGRPLIERITTVTGCVRQPANLLLRVGTTFAEAIEACGGFSEQPGMVTAGGGMTGLAAKSLDMSMTKATNGIVGYTQREARELRRSPCIRCARCAEACPARLRPYEMIVDCERRPLAEPTREAIRDC
ncbi:MAG: electron transport complex subunit RsxC, partial [Clostridiales bacterium]|nr:electron transport complex subunit RsxC [Clostridiales bacterium]